MACVSNDVITFSATT